MNNYYDETFRKNTEKSELAPLQAKLKELRAKMKEKLTNKEWFDTVSEINSVSQSIEAIKQRYYYKTHRVNAPAIPDIQHNLNKYIN